MEHARTTELGEGCAIVEYQMGPDLLAAAEAAAEEAIPKCEQRPLLKICGRNVPAPRNYYLATPPEECQEDAMGYAFSGGGAKQKPMGAAMAAFDRAFKAAAAAHDREMEANRVLVNHYQDEHEKPKSSIGWHGDTERGLRVGPSGVWMASLYRGPSDGRVPRRFLVKNNATGDGQGVVLAHGAVVVMRGEGFQHKFKHAVPKVGAKQAARERVSFTWRFHTSTGAKRAREE